MSDMASTFRDGAAYERRVGRWSRPVGEVFVAWLNVPPKCRWLDVGCGGGAFSDVLIARCAPASIVGVDPSEAQLAYARTRAGAKFAQFQRGDAQDLPFSAGSFDAAAMALVIQFLSDPLKAAVEMARVVRPGGTVGTYTWDIWERGAPFHPVREALEDIGISTPLPGREICRCDALRDVWERAGLDAVETRVIRVPAAFPDFDDYWEANTSADGPRGQILNDLSPAQRDRLRARLREILPVQPDGRIVYEAVANAVKGRVVDAGLTG
jgi:SAM-dependent methyltransferase